MKKLPETELEVMLALWELEAPATTNAIQDKLQENRPWNLSALQTVMTRLREKGFVSTEKNGKNRSFTPLIRKEDYLAEENRSVLQRLNGGSITSLVASLYDSEGITKKDLMELMDFINEKTGGNGS